MLKAYLEISEEWALNRLEKYEENPCNGYKRLLHLMQSDRTRSIGLYFTRLGLIYRVIEGK